MGARRRLVEGPPLSLSLTSRRLNQSAHSADALLASLDPATRLATCFAPRLTGPGLADLDGPSSMVAF